MEQLTRTLDDTSGKESEKDNKVNNDRLNPDVKKIMDEIKTCRLDIQMIAMDSVYVSNTLQHQRSWLPTDKKIVENAFVPTIEESVVREIMALDIDNQLQLLLLLGFGVFDIINKKKDTQTGLS